MPRGWKWLPGQPDNQFLGFGTFAPEFWRLIGASSDPSSAGEPPAKRPPPVGDEMILSPKQKEQEAVTGIYGHKPVWPVGPRPLIQEPEPDRPYGSPVPRHELPSPDEIAAVRTELERNRAQLGRMERGAEKFKNDNPGEAKVFDQSLAELRQTIERAEQALWQVERET